MCKVSLIVPVYNAASSLDFCLQSVENQTFKDFELILVDDGSTDDSGKMCDDFALKVNKFNVKVIHQVNRGVSAARNAGIQASEGEYILFLDSDDYLERDYIGKLVSVREKYPEAGHIWCGFQLVSDYMRTDAKTFFIKTEEAITVFDRLDYMDLYSHWMSQGPYCKLYYAYIIKKMSFNEDLNLGEDIVFNLEYLDRIYSTKIIFVNTILYNYVQSGENSLYTKYRENQFEINKIVDSFVKEKIEKWDLSDDAWKQFYASVYFQGINAMESTYRNGNGGLWNKISKNNKILQDSLFVDALNNVDLYINKYYKAALKTGNYLIVLLVEKLSTIRRGKTYE